MSNREVVAISHEPTLPWWTNGAKNAQTHRLAHLGCWEWDTKSDRITWSDDMYAIYGLSEQSFSGSYESFMQLVHPADREHVATTISTALKTGQPYNVYHRLSEPKSTYIIHAHGQPQLDDSGNVARVFGTAQDVTHLKESPTELTRHAQQLAATTNVGQTVTATLDMDLLFEQIVEQIVQLVPGRDVLLLLVKNDALTVAAANDPHFENNLELSPAGFLTGDESVPHSAWHFGPAIAERLPASLRAKLAYQPRSLLMAPMMMQEKWIGLILVLAEAEDAFGNEGLQLVEAAAGWAGIAVSNARKHSALKERLEELETIITISRLITGTVELDYVLPRIVESAREMVCQADWSVIHLHNEQRQMLEAVAASGLDAENPEYDVAPGEGVIGAVYAEGKFVNVSDLLDDERMLPLERKLDSRSLLVVPLQHGQELIGTLAVQCSEPCTYNEADERLLTALGLQACVAIQNARNFRQSEEMTGQLRRLTHRVVITQEEERQRIARDLHDDAGQMLTALRISLGLTRAGLTELEGPIGQNGHAATETNPIVKARQGINEAIELTDRSVRLIRQVIYNLRPPALIASNIATALEGLCRNFAQRTKINVQYGAVGVPALKDDANIILYRIVQECLTNVARHAEAENVKVNLSCGDDLLRIRIVDDGCGFATDSKRLFEAKKWEHEKWQAGVHPVAEHLNGIGLVGLAERCELLNGGLDIESAIDEGTTITVTVPISALLAEESSQ